MVGPGFDVRKDYYRILGVSADQCDFKTAFFKYAKQTHPDKGGDAEKFKEIREAYEVLTDPDLKEAYDRARLRTGFGASNGASSKPPPPRPRTQPSASTKPRPSPRHCSQHTRPKPSSYSYYESEDDSNGDHEASDSDASIPQDSLPPEFRQRKPAPYSSTSKQPKKPPRQNRESTGIPPLKDPSACVFADYYTPNYREGPLLQRVRASYRAAWRAWREAADEALDARHTLDHCSMVGSYAALLVWETKEAAASELQRKKWAAHRIEKAHVKRARELRARRRAAEAKVRSADAYAKRAGERRRRRGKARFGMGAERGFNW